ncbi:MAG: hypothetical protein MMC33_010190, partial [Icmadophila ericetorum]|nr:hypothetical protein [Icmadophila ericetorum]
MNYLARLMVDLRIYGTKQNEPTDAPRSRETQTEREGIYLEENIPKRNKFSKDGTCVTPQGMVTSSQIRDELQELKAGVEDCDPICHPGRRVRFDKLDPE